MLLIFEDFVVAAAEHAHPVRPAAALPLSRNAGKGIFVNDARVPSGALGRKRPVRENLRPGGCIPRASAAGEELICV
jgi:hypothetical protein